MDGLLTNTWRDILALIGAISPLRAAFVLLRRWLSKSHGKNTAWPQFGYLEMVKDSEELTPSGKKTVRIASAISGLVMIGLCSAGSYASTFKDSDFSAMVEIWSWILMCLIAVVQEIGLLNTILRYASSRVANDKHAVLGLMLASSLLFLLFLSYWATSTSERPPGWFMRLLLAYAAAYMFTFALVSLGEIVWQVEEWKDKRKEK